MDLIAILFLVFACLYPTGPVFDHHVRERHQQAQISRCGDRTPVPQVNQTEEVPHGLGK